MKPQKSPEINQDPNASAPDANAPKAEADAPLSERAQMMNRIRGNAPQNIPTDIRARNMIDMLGQLNHVLTEENRALKAPSSKILTPLVKEKNALFALYDESLEYLEKHPHFIKKVEKPLIDELRALGVIFEKLMKENEKQLSLSLRVSRHMMGIITDAAKSLRGNPRGYGKNGTPIKARQYAPVSLDQEL